MADAKITVTGGDKVIGLLREVRKFDLPDIEVGFFETARYPNVYTGKAPRSGERQYPHHVATVAAWQEYGTRAGTPERPFFRNVLNELPGDPAFRSLMENIVDFERRRVSITAAKLVGQYVASKVQESIRTLKEPPNAPRTIARKQSSNPLIDVGIMRTSVTYEVRGE